MLSPAEPFLLHRGHQLAVDQHRGGGVVLRSRVSVDSQHGRHRSSGPAGAYTET